MLKNDTIAGNNNAVLTVKDTAPYSDAIERSLFLKTSFFCKGRDLIIQVSNFPRPDEASDDDWAALGGTASGDSLVWTDAPATWMRVKGVQEGDRVYVQSTAITR